VGLLLLMASPCPPRALAACWLEWKGHTLWLWPHLQFVVLGWRQEEQSAKDQEGGTCSVMALVMVVVAVVVVVL
jgi:hypothetical protein